VEKVQRENRIKSIETQPKAEVEIVPPELQRRRVLPSSWFSTEPDSSEEEDFFKDPADKKKKKKLNQTFEATVVTFGFDSPNIQPQLVELREHWKKEAEVVGHGTDAEPSDVQLAFKIFVFFPSEIISLEPERCRRMIPIKFLQPKIERNVTGHKMPSFAVKVAPASSMAVVAVKEAPEPNMAAAVGKEALDVSNMAADSLPPFARDLKKLLLDVTYADLKIRLQSHEFSAHRLILARKFESLKQQLNVYIYA
jgi:hypothetical protein